jgi:outer membrane lipoprotein-sorting protein/peroxiredoxin
MTRLYAIRSNIFRVCFGWGRWDSPICAQAKIGTIPLAVLCLALVMTTGCQQSETPKGNAKGKESVSQPVDKAGNETAPKTTDGTAKQLSARDVLSRMIAAYRKASSYRDLGSARLYAEADGKPIQDETVNFSLAFVRPNKLRFHAYKAELACDGKKMFAYVSDVPGQIFSRPAPERLTFRNVQPDRAVAVAMNRGFAGGLPQIQFLFGEDPLKTLLADLGEPELADAGQIGGRDYYRVKFKGADGETTLWIDRDNYVLRRVALPTDALRDALSQETPISNVSVVADFKEAQLNGEIDPTAFEFEVPKDTKVVDFLVPPHMGQLLNQKTPEFTFTDLSGRAVTPETTAGKTTVLAFWSIRFEPCRQMLKELEEVYQKYKDNPKVAFYAVCRDPVQLTNADMEKFAAELGVHVPMVRDLKATGAAFNLGDPPTTFIINDKGVVQHCEGGLNPRYAEALQGRLVKVLAGEDIYQEPQKQFLEQVEELRKFAKASESDAPGDAMVVREERLPQTKTAPRSEPSVLKLSPLWKCTDLKLPGNIVVLNGAKGPERLLVIENCTAVAEVGLNGKVLGPLHQLNLATNEAVGSLRTAVGADGRRYYATFLVSEQRCHLYDENWNLIVHFPKDALEHRHAGIADVRLGDLDGDGKLKMFVSYWDVVGVQAVSLEGDRLWTNRTAVSSVACMAIGTADAKGRRDLICTGNAGTLVFLDSRGERRGEVAVGKRLMFRIADADLRGDGKPLWCGLAATKPGEAMAVGFALDEKGSLASEELWDYPLPPGVPSQPIEPLIAGRVTRSGPGQWILPGPDGSIHIIAADGKPLDKFNYGAVLHGLATFELDGQPVLVVASPNGLEAWKVE